MSQFVEKASVLKLSELDLERAFASAGVLVADIFGPPVIRLIGNKGWVQHLP
jgi:hypothetical protein